MPASSNFNQAIREAQTSSIVGPNVVQKALPYVGGGMVLTSLGVLAGVSLIATNPGLFPASFNSCINFRIDFVFYSHKCCK